MIGALLGTIVVGMALGYAFLDVSAKPLFDDTLMAALDFMGFVAGIEIGSNRSLLKRICTPKNMALAVALPLGTVIGSLGGAYFSHFVTGIGAADSVLVGSGLGWYSLSSVIISTMHSTELGTIAFFANICTDSYFGALAQAYLYCSRWRWYYGFAAAPGNQSGGNAHSDVFFYQRTGFILAGTGAAVAAFAISIVVFYRRV